MDFASRVRYLWLRNVPDRLPLAVSHLVLFKTNPMIQFTENGILQKLGSIEKNWTIPQLLETYEPLAGEPLSVRNKAMKQLLPIAEEHYSELSEAAQLRYDFWKQLLPERIAEQKFNYTTKVTDTYRWELTVNSEGLFYKDISPEYGQVPGQVHEQLFSDFWFYGPLMPMPDLQVRKQVVANIRNAFLQVGPVSQKHFELFEYPTSGDMPSWEDGDYTVMDFGHVRSYGIDTGRTNWHDGLVYQAYTSFEQFLTRPDWMVDSMPPKTRKAIEKYLGRHVKTPPTSDTPEATQNETSKRLFIENGGNIQYIGRDGFIDEYKATSAEEAAWRVELIEKYTERLGEERNETVLEFLAKTLEYNGVKNVSELLCEAGKKATPAVQQSIAQVLIKQLDAEKGAEVLIDLLKYEDEESYWRNYAFNMMFRMRQNKTVQNFLIECLKGDNEIHFKKAVDVLSFWGMQGDKAFTDRQLLLSLNWEDACAADPNFQQSLNKVSSIILNNK